MLAAGAAGPTRRARHASLVRPSRGPARGPHQVAVELGDDGVALAQLAQDPGLGLEEGALAQAQQDPHYDARRRLHEDARHRHHDHDHEVPLLEAAPARNGGSGAEGSKAGARGGAGGGGAPCWSRCALSRRPRSCVWPH